jgi:hypothetical protein
MSGERFDYSNERWRHEKFVGREALLARLDQLLVAEGPDRWVVVTGGPGVGKSAILAEWLARRQRAGATVPHHFIRRGIYDWDDPAKLVGSLVAQIEDRFPEARDPEADPRMHAAARLARALSRVSDHSSGPGGERLTVLIIAALERRVFTSGVVRWDAESTAPGVRMSSGPRARHGDVRELRRLTE